MLIGGETVPPCADIRSPEQRGKRISLAQRLCHRYLCRRCLRFAISPPAYVLQELHSGGVTAEPQTGIASASWAPTSSVGIHRWLGFRGWRRGGAAESFRREWGAGWVTEGDLAVHGGGVGNPCRGRGLDRGIRARQRAGRGATGHAGAGGLFRGACGAPARQERCDGLIAIHSFHLTDKMGTTGAPVAGAPSHGRRGPPAGGGPGAAREAPPGHALLETCLGAGPRGPARHAAGPRRAARRGAATREAPRAPTRAAHPGASPRWRRCNDAGADDEGGIADTRRQLQGTEAVAECRATPGEGARAPAQAPRGELDTQRDERAHQGGAGQQSAPLRAEPVSPAVAS